MLLRPIAAACVLYKSTASTNLNRRKRHVTFALMFERCCRRVKGIMYDGRGHRVTGTTHDVMAIA